MCADDRSKQSSSAALIISIFSAVFTGGTAYYAYEQARYVQERIRNEITCFLQVVCEPVTSTDADLSLIHI